MLSPLAVEFPELAHLSREDLEDLISNPVYFQAMFHSLQCVKDLYRSQAELGMANEAIATNNLALQQRLYELRSKTKDAFDEAKELEARWKKLDKEQKEIYQRLTPQFLLMRLRHSTTAQDDASEALASSFVQQLPSNNGSISESRGMEVDEFIKEFRELRKVYHKRAMWGENDPAGINIYSMKRQNIFISYGPWRIRLCHSIPYSSPLSNNLILVSDLILCSYYLYSEFPHAMNITNPNSPTFYDSLGGIPSKSHSHHNPSSFSLLGVMLL